MATITESSYQKVRDQCLASGKLWEDPDFPADGTSIGPKPTEYPVIWKRPHEICDKLRVRPEFMLDGGDRFDVIQGSLGNCWMLAALASITTYQQLFKRMVPLDQSIQKGKYTGVFRFHFWKCGKWVEVLVDDRLPVAFRKLVYADASPLHEFWGPLLEKAYAKFYGNYQSIESGCCTEALTDFTGCLAQRLNIADFTPKDLWRIFLKFSERNSILSASVNDSENANTLKRGIPAGHAYSITAIKKVTLEDGTKRNLIHVRNPWGDGTEWTGRWSDNSPEWKKVSPKTRQELGLVKKEDGEFWIQCSDFIQNFDALEICYLEALDLLDSPGGSKCWSTSTFHGKWIKDKTAGGQLVHSPSFSKNPQFAVTVDDHDEDDDKMASFVVELTQMDRRQLKLDNLKIGFYVYRVPSGVNLPLTQDFLTKAKHSGGKDVYDFARAVTKGFTMEPGTYVIISTTEKENEEGEFMLRVFSESDHKSHAFNG